MGGVSQDTSAEEVKSYFGQFGKVEETVMLMDQQTKRHRGFGFVTFDNEEIVDRVCEIHFHTIKNKKVECKKAQPKEIATPQAQLLQKRILIGNGLGLGIRIPATPNQLLSSPVATTFQAQPSSAANAFMFQQQMASLQAQNLASLGYGKILTTFNPALQSLR